MAASMSALAARPCAVRPAPASRRMVACSATSRRDLLASVSLLLSLPGAARAAAPPPVAVSPFRKAGQITISRPPPEFIENEVRQWETWMAPVTSFPYHFYQDEDAMIVGGRAIITPRGGRPVEIKAGDFVTFPAGMDCTWEIKEPIHKVYKEYVNWDTA